ncbi:hypothetical protein Q8A67_024182 [Cirrhinus molitorella]|uniref:Uncharacterized protein n=1 Tax=Cirrhinus molitorella TaxID=172907 RepID=A0AA88P1H7_9TELE|nr:hypothetical protein Q8A67_024182 [Cirrhinus molitorella]
MMSGRQETAGDYRLCPRELPDTASYQAGRKEAECVNTALHTSLIQALMDEDAAAVLREGKGGKHIANIKLRFPAGLVFFCSKTTTSTTTTQIITDRQIPSRSTLFPGHEDAAASYCIAMETSRAALYGY